MPRFNEAINNFINGEVSPKLYGRTDSEIYKRSTRNSLNMINHPQGGMSRRMGSQIVLEKLQSTTGVRAAINAGARVIDFVYSKDEAYLVVFPCEYTNYGSLGYPIYIYNPKEDVAFAPFFSGGSGAGFNYETSLGVGTTSSVSNNTMTSSTILSEMQYAQNGAVMYFAHQDLVPFYIARLSKNAFLAADFYRPFFNFGATYSEVDIWSKWPYRDLNISTTTLTNSATTGTITITASAATFTANMVGTPVCITNAGVTGVAFITVFTSSTQVTAVVVRTLPAAAAYTTWYLSAWSKEVGYPRSVAFSADGRTVWGFTKTEPEKLWFSQAGDITELANFNTLNTATTKVSSDPGAFSPASIQANEGLWIKAGSSRLLIGTRGSEYSVDTLSGALPFASPKAQTSYGSEAVQPAAVDDVPVFVQRGFKKLREMIFDYRTEGYIAPEISFYAEHIFNKSQATLGDASVSKIKAMAYQALNNNILWIIDTNGYLYGCTKSRENEVTAFHRHELGGNLSGTFPVVSSICSLPSTNGTADNLYAVVTRTINGSSLTYIESLYNDFNGTSLHSNLETKENQPVFMDCAKVFRPRTANFWARLSANSTAEVAGGLTTGTTVGTMNYTQGFAGASAVTSHISWDGTSNADFAQVGCIEFDWYSIVSSPAGTATLLTISQAAGSTNNLIRIDVTTTSNVVLTIRDSTGTAIINGVTVGNLITEGINPFAGNSTPIHFELNYSLTSGATRLFVNGRQLGSTITSTGTRTTAIDLIRLNADESGTQSRADFYYGELRIFNAVQHTANFEVFPPNQKTTTIRGLNYLEGQAVSVLADGIYSGPYTVASGSITLSASASTVIVGLNYNNLLEIQPVDAGTGIGSAIGSIKRIDRANIRFNKTAAAKVGPSTSSLEEIVFRTAATPITDPIILVTDDKVVDFRGDYDRQAAMVIYNADPLPCNVTCVSLRGVTGDV